MLNISKKIGVSTQMKAQNIRSLERVESKVSGKVLLRLIAISMIVLLIMMFIPWTQNIQTHGKVITLRPEQRPQTVNTIIAGSVEKWYVKEGDFVKKGDTLVHLTEIKDSFMDPNLLVNTDEQLKLKEKSVLAYQDKVGALNNQIDALSQEIDLKLKQAKIKLQQAQLKVEGDSIAYDAALVNLKVMKDQYVRMEGMESEGLKSLTELENRNVKLQDAKSYELNAKNKLLTSRSDLINAQVDLLTITTKYKSEIAKSISEKSTAESILFDAEINVNKLENQYANYSIRNSYYFILAPQDGYVTKMISNGLMETIKEGDALLTIMPTHYDLAVELYVEPFDLPLLSKGQSVRIQFDGWPAIVFSGWPNKSYGTYGGTVYAVDKFIGDNGKYRVLVKPDETDHAWPTALQFGSGTKNMIMLNDVPIWYELWRNINGFPPDFYIAEKDANETIKAEKK